jgi:hypothetical protein
VTKRNLRQLVDEIFLLDEEIKRLQNEMKPLKAELKVLAEEHDLKTVAGSIGLAVFNVVATPDRPDWKAIWDRFDKDEWVQDGLLKLGGETMRLSVMELSAITSKMELGGSS